MTKQLKTLFWRARSLLLAGLAIAGGMGASVAATPAACPAATTAHALLTIPVGKSGPADLAERLAAWKKAGAVTNALLLKQFDGPDKPGWSQLAVLDFADETAYAKWKADAGAKLGPDVIASRADILTDNVKQGRDSSKAIFVATRYESLVTPAQYQAYTDAYIEPNMANQKFSGIMTRYTMYLDREATGGLAHPKALLLTEYASDAEFARKSAVKDAYKKALLETHPEWKRINDSKTTIRVDLDETLARTVALGKN